MKNKQLTADYWNSRYLAHSTGWNLGEVSPPLKAYIDQLEDLEVRVLVPGAGFGYEANYLFIKGCKAVHLCDWSEDAVRQFTSRFPNFPKELVYTGDFFELSDQFDLILEQTFFCALDPELRAQYVRKMHELLVPGGKLVGLLFSNEFEEPGPPFGGSQKEYFELFSPFFKIKIMEQCYNSVSPRSGNELFFILEKITFILFFFICIIY